MSKKTAANSKKLSVAWAREVRFDLPVAALSPAKAALPVEVVDMSFSETMSNAPEAVGSEMSGCRTAPGKIEVRLRELPPADALS
jgi:hypothetical protein